MVAHTSTFHALEAKLVYMVSSRPARAAQRDPVWGSRKGSPLFLRALDQSRGSSVLYEVQDKSTGQQARALGSAGY